MAEVFTIEKPQFDAGTGVARFSYGLGGHRFTETVELGAGRDAGASFAKLLDLAAMVLGVSYFKLRAPFAIAAPDIGLTEAERDFVLDVYENGLGEFYARNDLKRFGRLDLETARDPGPAPAPPALGGGTLLPIGGGKDSLVSAQLLERAGLAFTPFAVNPKGPILGCVERLGRAPLYVKRTLDAGMIALSKQPGYYNGHVPSTAIVSMIAALTALVHGQDRIVLSNERSASEANTVFDGRETNHQHSKSLDFERRIASVLADATGGALGYFSLLRPYSEARIAALFARETRFDDVFSSCNRNFRLSGHDGALWCGTCPKCHFVFLVMAPVMERARLVSIFGQNLLDVPANEAGFRELTGLTGQKPWECVGEILENAVCLHRLAAKPEWRADALVRALAPELLAQYGPERLAEAERALFADSAEHLVPERIADKVRAHAA